MSHTPRDYNYGALPQCDAPCLEQLDSLQYSFCFINMGLLGLLTALSIIVIFISATNLYNKDENKTMNTPQLINLIIGIIIAVISIGLFIGLAYQNHKFYKILGFPEYK